MRPENFSWFAEMCIKKSTSLRQTASCPNSWLLKVEIVVSSVDSVDSVEPIRLQQSPRQSATRSASGRRDRVKLTSGGRDNAFPTSNQGLLYTIHHPNACPNNTEYLDFWATWNAENTAPQQPKAASKDGSVRFWEVGFRENIHLCKPILNFYNK